MRFVADESCDFAIVELLRALGHDVVAVVEASPRLADEDVLELARDDRRILLTEDKDFGELVYAEGMRNCGVVLIRLPGAGSIAMVSNAVEAIHKHGEELSSRFTVVQPGRIRIGSGKRRSK